MKRFASILLVLCMLLSGAYAEETVHTHEYIGAVTTEATCTAEGVKTFTCDCGDSFIQPIAMASHHYADGKCTICGAADPDYVAPAEETAEEITTDADAETPAEIDSTEEESEERPEEDTSEESAEEQSEEEQSENECTHTNAWDYYVDTENTERKYSDGDTYCILTRTNVQKMGYCPECGLEWAIGDIIPEYTLQTSHNYSDEDICVNCGHDRCTCQHSDTYSWYIDTEDTETTYTDDGSYCIRTKTNVQKKYRCRLCSKEWVEEETIPEYTQQTSHNYSDEDICVNCGHDRSTCQHSDTYSWYVDTEATETTYTDDGRYCIVSVKHKPSCKLSRVPSKSIDN